MSANQEYLLVSKGNLLQGIDQALTDYQVAALTKKDDQFLYDYITQSSSIEFTYQPTVLSPKKFFFPQEEEILSYESDGKVATKIEAKPLVLFGIRPCDLNAIKILSEAFAEGYGDPYYLAKREKTVIIGIDCQKICDPDAFCYKVKAQDAEEGYDVMLYEADDNYLIKIANEKGEQFVTKYLTTEKASEEAFANFQKQKDAAFAKEVPFRNLDKFPEIFDQNKQHPIWREEGSRCLSCGSCIMVCPTCYCFDVKDEWELNLKKGNRTRKWDACMLNCFAIVAGGENFRRSATDRLRHRIHRKFDYLMKKHGQSVCVGCGRCVRACLAKISPKTIAEAIVEEKQAEGN